MSLKKLVNFALLFGCLMAVGAPDSADAQRPNRGGGGGTDQTKKYEAPSYTNEEASVEAKNSEGKLRYTVQVAKFGNESALSNWPYAYRWNHVTDAWDAILGVKLAESGRFIVVADKEMTNEAIREIEFSQNSGHVVQGKKTPKKGRMSPAQLLVRGTVTHFNDNASSTKTGGILGRVGLGTSKSEINMTFEIYDAQTRQLFAQKSIKASSRKWNINAYRLPVIGHLQQELNGNVLSAVEDAAEQAVAEMVKQLPRIPWQGTVVTVKSNKVYINRGKREGVRVDDVFDVGGGDEIIDPDTGELLAYDFDHVATVMVKKVLDNMSICELIDGSGAQKKMLVVPPGTYDY